MSHAKLKQTNLTGANLSRDNLSGVLADGAGFVRARLRNAKLTGISAIRADFFGADLSGADLTDGDFRASRLQEANLDGAVTAGMKTKGALLVDGHHRTVGRSSLRLRASWGQRGVVHFKPSPTLESLRLFFARHWDR